MVHINKKIDNLLFNTLTSLHIRIHLNIIFIKVIIWLNRLIVRKPITQLPWIQIGGGRYEISH